MENIIETQRLFLRPWRESDAQRLFEICLDPELRASGITYFDTVSDCEEILSAWAKSSDMKAIVRRDSGDVIGLVSVGDMNRYPQYRELEYAVAREARGMGFAYEAVSGMLSYLFSETDVEVVAAWVHGDNGKSCRVLEKLGFTFEGRLRRHARNRGDTLCWSVLREEWKTDK